MYPSAAWWGIPAIGAPWRAVRVIWRSRAASSASSTKVSSKSPRRNRRRWSGYRTFKLRYCRIIGVRSARSTNETAFQTVVRRLERLRVNTHVAQDRHEVGVAVPPGHHMDMQVINDSCAGDAALIESDVKALGPVLDAEDGHRHGDQVHGVRDLVRRHLRERPDVAVHDGHEVAGRVGVQIEDQEGPGPPDEDEVLPVIGSGEGFAEHASAGRLGGADVGHTPGRPEAFHTALRGLSR